MKIFLFITLIFTLISTASANNSASSFGLAKADTSHATLLERSKGAQINTASWECEIYEQQCLNSGTSVQVCEAAFFECLETVTGPYS